MGDPGPINIFLHGELIATTPRTPPRISLVSQPAVTATPANSPIRARHNSVVANAASRLEVARVLASLDVNADDSFGRYDRELQSPTKSSISTPKSGSSPKSQSSGFKIPTSPDSRHATSTGSNPSKTASTQSTPKSSAQSTPTKHSSAPTKSRLLPRSTPSPKLKLISTPYQRPAGPTPGSAFSLTPGTRCAATALLALNRTSPSTPTPSFTQRTLSSTLPPPRATYSPTTGHFLSRTAFAVALRSSEDVFGPLLASEQWDAYPVPTRVGSALLPFPSTDPEEFGPETNSEEEREQPALLDHEDLYCSSDENNVTFDAVPVVESDVALNRYAEHGPDLEHDGSDGEELSDANSHEHPDPEDHTEPELSSYDLSDEEDDYRRVRNPRAPSPPSVLRPGTTLIIPTYVAEHDTEHPAWGASDGDAGLSAVSTNITVSGQGEDGETSLAGMRHGVHEMDVSLSNPSVRFPSFSGGPDEPSSISRRIDGSLSNCSGSPPTSPGHTRLDESHWSVNPIAISPEDESVDQLDSIFHNDIGSVFAEGGYTRECRGLPGVEPTLDAALPTCAAVSRPATAFSISPPTSDAPSTAPPTLIGNSLPPTPPQFRLGDDPIRVTPPKEHTLPIGHGRPTNPPSAWEEYAAQVRRARDTCLLASNADESRITPRSAARARTASTQESKEWWDCTIAHLQGWSAEERDEKKLELRLRRHADLQERSVGAALDAARIAELEAKLAKTPPSQTPYYPTGHYVSASTSSSLAAQTSSPRVTSRQSSPRRLPRVQGDPAVIAYEREAMETFKLGLQAPGASTTSRSAPPRQRVLSAPQALPTRSEPRTTSSCPTQATTRSPGDGMDEWGFVDPESPIRSSPKHKYRMRMSAPPLSMPDIEETSERGHEAPGERAPPAYDWMSEYAREDAAAALEESDDEGVSLEEAWRAALAAGRCSDAESNSSSETSEADCAMILEDSGDDIPMPSAPHPSFRHLPEPFVRTHRRWRSAPTWNAKYTLPVVDWRLLNDHYDPGATIDMLLATVQVSRPASVDERSGSEQNSLRSQGHRRSCSDSTGLNLNAATPQERRSPQYVQAIPQPMSTPRCTAHKPLPLLPVPEKHGRWGFGRWGFRKRIRAWTGHVGTQGPRRHEPSRNPNSETIGTHGSPVVTAKHTAENGNQGEQRGAGTGNGKNVHADEDTDVPTQCGPRRPSHKITRSTASAVLKHFRH